MWTKFANPPRRTTGIRMTFTLANEYLFKSQSPVFLAKIGNTASSSMSFAKLIDFGTERQRHPYCLHLASLCQLFRVQ